MTDGPGWFPGVESPPPSGPSRLHVLLIVFLTVCALALVAGTAVLLLGGRSGTQNAEDAEVANGDRDPPQPQESESKPPKQRPPRDRKPRKQPANIGRPADLTDFARQVAEIRGLQLRDPLRARLVTPPSLADKVSELAFAEQDLKEVRNNERLLVALRLADPGIDLAQQVEDLYREQILGLYVPEEATLYVRGTGADSPAQQMTTAHEITHALQDQAFNLVKLQRTYEDDADAALAVLSLIEGDAVLTQQLWAQRHLTPEQLQEAITESSAGGEALERVPDYLRASLFFPYSQGARFVGELYREGGFAAVDEAFANPPTSSEHVMHPERYRSGDDPVKTRVTARPGGAWKFATRYAFGEFDLQQLLTTLGSDTADEAAEGWGGGEVRSWSKGPDTAVGAVLRFDTSDDAAQACAALPRWYSDVAAGRSTGTGTIKGDRDHLAFRCFGDTVQFGIAPQPQTARRLAGPP